MINNENYPAPSIEKPGWKLTFHDEFDRPQLNDMYWYPAYRSGRKDYFKRIGKESRWYDHNAHYVIEDSILKLRIDEKLPFRPERAMNCISCITTSDYRISQDAKSFQLLEKFAQKYGRFEIRCKMPRGSGLMSAFWLHQTNPFKQEYTIEGVRKKVGDGVVEIDIFEQTGLDKDISDSESKVHLNVHFTEDAHHLHTIPADVSADFHVWAMEWEEGKVDWYFDDTLIESYRGPTPQEKMFILVALFQFSQWGEIDTEMVYPKDLEIDYVRVYQKVK